MIGLLFFGAIAIWAVVALALGSKIPQWLGIKRHRIAIGFAFAILLFVAPVADEIIAWPQMQALCKQVNGLRLSPALNETKAYGRSFYYVENNSRLTLLPRSIEIMRRDYAYVDATSKEPILQGVWFEPLRGMLGMPNGSSGGHMTLLLSKCDSIAANYDSQGVPNGLSHLKLTKVPMP